MKNKKISILILIALIFGLAPEISKANTASYKKTFIITAYYSPVEGQDVYLRGSYEADIRLNGSGARGASGKEVFPGMIAAPKTYTFGTKVEIPGLGIGEIADRGGAIVKAGKRGNSFDRLDIWMGKGEEGLFRALAWGKRTVVTTIHPEPNNLEVNFDFSGIMGMRPKSLIKVPEFKAKIGKGEKGEHVKKVQEALKRLKFYKKEVSGKYDSHTIDAVFDFQVSEEILASAYDFGAGYFGPKTSKALEKRLIEYEQQKLELASLKKQIEKKEEEFFFGRELSLGKSGEDVKKLQEFLERYGFFKVKPTGIFGKITQNALKRFQIHAQIIRKSGEVGAGRFGPKSKERINAILKGYYAAEKRKQERLKVNIEKISDNFNRTLSLGDKGEDVKKLQNYLKRKGYLDANPTGFFGEKTKKAVLEFQLDRKVIISEKDFGAGVFGNQTKKALAQVI